MSVKPAEFKWVYDVDDLARHVADLWTRYDGARDEWKEQKKEIRNFLFATDTRGTTNSKLPWMNSTTVPKLCQIRDNLHANYMAALFPHGDEWLQWEGADEVSNNKQKAAVILAYMRHKLKEQNFKTVVSEYIYDFIDTGVVIGDVVWEEKYKQLENSENETVANYVGPRAVRVSAYDHVFDPTVKHYRDAHKVTRYVKTLGQLLTEAEDQPHLNYDREVINKAIENRQRFQMMGRSDTPKDDAYQIDGFGSLFEYFQSSLVEVLEFEGDYYDEENQELHRDRIVTVIDRSYVVRNDQNPSYLGESTKQFVGWRLRPDNLWAMGPLDNLVGMQYRIDHIENATADAVDQFIIPPKKVRGYVQEFDDMPGERILVGDDGDVEFLRPPLDQMFANNQKMEIYMRYMEEFAGAPREAMGIRTPGEKTAFEIQSLENAASRLFQSKIRYFEEEFLEPLLNKMFEMAVRNFPKDDLIRVINDELGVVEFQKITKQDVAAKGKFRPIGARHFAEEAKTIQEMSAFYNSAMGQDPTVMAHFSPKGLARMVEKLLNIEKYNVVKDNSRVFETAQTQKLANATQEQVEVDAITPLEGEEGPDGL